MIEQYYTCELLSDVVLNSKLATEGNMTTLEYIPGSTFLGIVAKAIYDYHKDNAYAILHAGEVSFGDAYISPNGNEMSYPIPFSLFQDKLDKSKTWVHHLLDDEHFTKFREKGIQLKQERTGYLTPSGLKLKGPEKNFAIKSAQERDERRSKDGAMFGFESLVAGQQFVFSIRYENADYQEIVEKFLISNKRIGKSKTAQFGQVCIKKLENEQAPKRIDSIPNSDYTLVYAESNLCFFNKYGQSTYQPTVKDLGLSGGSICWEKSQIRTYSYSPWNGIRNTPNTQRDCILKGSVFYVKGAVSPEDKTKSVGEYQAEGLGRISYNPAFLKGNDSTGEWEFELIVVPENKESGTPTETKPKDPTPETDLGHFLRGLKAQKVQELELSNAINKCLKHDHSKELMRITPSQWGGIRAYAENTSDIQELEAQIFKNYITHGVAYEKYWKKGGRISKLQLIFDENKQHGTLFFAKYAAEMAKEAQKLKNQH